MMANAAVLALRAIRRNVLRSSLTMLGIVIGVAAVIVMVTLGSGATAQITQQIANLGSNLLMVTPGQRMGPGQSGNPFEMEDVEAIEREIAAVAAVAPVISRATAAIYGNANWSTSVIGSNNQLFTVRRSSLTAGRLFSDAELRGGKAVCILGATVQEKLFGGQLAVGSHIRLQDLSCQVIGVLVAKGQSAMGSDQDDVVVLPLRTVQRRITGDQNVHLIQLSVRDGASTATVQKDLTSLLRTRRHISGTKEDDFRVTDMKEISSMLTGTTEVLTALLGAVAAVSLLVGGIGIMNIMLVSVTERTHEIGIRLAIGAMEREVLMQFLVEAVALSSLGGLVGIVTAIVASFALAQVLGVPFVFDPAIVLIAFAFSAVVGMIFGYFPARQAARLDPIDALRHE